jgi:hypothetical protein
MDRDTLRAKLTQHRDAAATMLKSFPESDYIRGTRDTWNYVLRLMNEHVLDDALCPPTPDSSEPFTFGCVLRAHDGTWAWFWYQDGDSGVEKTRDAAIAALQARRDARSAVAEPRS